MPTATPPPYRSIKRTSRAPQAAFQAPTVSPRKRPANVVVRPKPVEAEPEVDEEHIVTDEPDLEDINADEPEADEEGDEDEAEQSSRPTEHNGISIVREETRDSPVAPGHPLKVTKLHLSDGTVAFGCLDCRTTCDTRAELHKHRNAEHGARFGKRRPRVTFPKVKDEDPLDLVLPPRPDGLPAPTDVMLLTIGELLSLAPSFGALFDYISRLESQIEQMTTLLREQKDEIRNSAHAVAVYPGLQAEVVDLRMRIKDVGGFDDMKTEVIKLRAWKRNMIKRLESMGFNLNDEER